MGSKREDAVRISNVCKRFTSTPVLRNLNMTVPEGTIYGLLGPSGCGKTTLLRLILGRTELDEGSVQLKVQRRRDIGYMPQDIVLQQDMTIEDTFHFFGRIFGMKHNEITKVREELISLLDLPQSDRIVSTLSGGQQRRLSFGVTLLHDPQLLVLDEPTVGVDPVLRETLWAHLLKLANAGKTIIITTHYIEEARQAHTIGLMRGGTLLAEDAPDTFLLSQNSTNLEEAFLKLCYRHEEDLEVMSSHEVPKPKTKIKGHLIQESRWNFNRFMAQLIKNLLWARYNISIMTFLMYLPILMGFLSNIVFNTPPWGLQIGVVSEELGEDGFANCPQNSSEISCVFDHVTCQYWKRPPSPTFEYVEYQNVAEGKEAIEEGEIWALLHFKKNYSAALETRLEYGLQSSDFTVLESTADVWVDLSNAWLARQIKIVISKSFIDFVKSFLTSCGYPARAADIPIKFEDAPVSKNDAPFTHFALPAVMCSFCFYLTLMFTSAAIMMERNLGLLDRSLTAGMTFTEVVCAHVVMQFLVVSIQTSALLIISYIIYDNPIMGNPFSLILLILFVEGMGIAYGFFLAMLFDAERLASYASVGTLVALITILGVVWPFQGMHYILRRTRWLIPVIPAITSYNSISQKGWSFYHFDVYYGFLQTAFWTWAFSFVAYIIFKIKKIGS